MMALGLQALGVFRYRYSNSGIRILRKYSCPFAGQARTKVWLGAFKKRTKNVQLQNEVTIEEPKKDARLSKVDSRLEEMRHYMRTSDLNDEAKKRTLALKLREFVKETPDFSANPRIMPTIDSIMRQIEQLDESKSSSEVINRDELVDIFIKSFMALNSVDMKHIPQYVVRIASNLAEGTSEVSPKLEIMLLEVATKINGGDLRKPLGYLMHSKTLTELFVLEFFKYHESKGTLNLDLFTTFISAAKESKRVSLIGNQFFVSLIEFIERKFEDQALKIHQYKDLDRNILKIQEVINVTVSSSELSDILPATSLRLLSLLNDLDAFNEDLQTCSNIDSILNSLQRSAKLHGFGQIMDSTDQQTISEDIVLSFLVTLWHRPQFQVLNEGISNYIIKNENNYSPEMVIRCLIYVNIMKQNTGNSAHILEKVLDIVKDRTTEGNPNDVYDAVLQVVLSSTDLDPDGEFVTNLSKSFKESHVIEPSVYSYKYRIDKALKLKDLSKATSLFEESLSNVVPWSQYSDITLHKTLNDLIISSCRFKENIEEIFPMFKMIKQQMVNTQCGIETITLLADKMLAAEYVGDTIEMLKRELPKIDKDSARKLPTKGTFARRYRQLFDLLHEFVITYKNEATFETNWVLYGELHKYFDVPFESYLPTIKFFCGVDRHNAALLIFRQMKKLNELHGIHFHLPPSREIYMYLFQEFGDKLYQEGVEEIHEYLKMDVNIPEQDIGLQNCVLEAYCNLQDVPKANDLFLAMSTDNKESGGINEKTVEIMIKTYTYSDMRYVFKFWNNISKYGVIPNYPIFRQYIIAHVYNGFIEESFQVIEEMKDYHIEFDKGMLLAMHNYCLETRHQDKVAKWASDNYGEEWEQLRDSNALRIASNYAPDGNLLIES